MSVATAVTSSRASSLASTQSVTAVFVPVARALLAAMFLMAGPSHFNPAMVAMRNPRAFLSRHSSFPPRVYWRSSADSASSWDSAPASGPRCWLPSSSR